MKFLSSPSDSSAVKMTLRKSGGVVPAKTFFDCYKLDYSVVRQYSLAFNDTERIFYFDLDLPYGDKDIPVHPHTMFVSIATETVEELKLAERMPPKAKAGLVSTLFTLVAHKHLSLTQSRTLLKKCVAADSPPKDRAELLVWKVLSQHQDESNS